MTLSTSNRAQLRLIKEAEFGVIPAAGDPNNLRMTGESLAFAITKSESAEIRDDRQTTDLVPTGAGANGGVNFELSYREYDVLLAAALQCVADPYGVQTAGVGQGVGATFAADFTATTITNTGAALTGDDAFTNLARGQWFRVNAPGDANDGKICRVHSTTAPTATVITLDAATPLTVSTDTGVSLSSTRFANGVVQESFTLERALADVNQFFAYRGMTLSKLNLKIASGAITTGSMEFMGKDGVRDTVTLLPGTPVESFNYDVQNGVSGVGYVMEGGAALTGTFIKSMDLTIENSLRARDAIGTLGSVSIGSGSFKVSGTIEVYLADGTLYDKFLNNTTTSLQVVTKDGSNNGYAFQIPAVKYGDAKVNAGGKDQDIMLSLPFTGIRDIVTGKTMLVDRFGA